MSKITVTLEGKKMTAQTGATVKMLLPEEHRDEDDIALGARVNQVVHGLDHKLCDGDEVQLLRMSDREGSRIYIRGLLHMLDRAAETVYGKHNVRVQHSINDALYCELIDGELISPFDLERMEKLMQKYANEDMPFIKTNVRRETAMAMLSSTPNTARLLENTSLKEVSIYTCGSVSEFQTGIMPSSTGYMKKFKLVNEGRGFVLLYPRLRSGMRDMKYERYPKTMYIFQQSDNWANIMKCNYLADLNDQVLAGKTEKLVLINEALHEKTIAGFADEIKRSGKRVVLVSGPSSSGKTTFTQRLEIQLRVFGFEPLKISMDNYYIDRDKVPLDTDGLPDLECIEALDVPKFNEQVTQLLQGETILLPEFDFPTGKSKKGTKKVRMEKNGVLLIEGIHGLNPQLSASISDDDKFRIFISAQTQLNFDDMLRISTTDIRLMRRIARDRRHRGTSAEQTLMMWGKVRAGENKWVFPFEENADVMFNSTLFYEICFLKNDVYDVLHEVAPTSSVYSDARRLINILDFVVPCKKSDIIPRTSLLREFLGDGCFEQ